MSYSHPADSLVAAAMRGYAIFRRADDDGGCWQGVAGGAEFDETPRQAAVRELSEETGIDAPGRWIALDSIGSVPVSVFGDWPGRPDVVIQKLASATRQYYP
jgi:8-oxo-dGTP pyrophosphatase MutT (NUDIX family)